MEFLLGSLIAGDGLGLPGSAGNFTMSGPITKASFLWCRHRVEQYTEL